jgi:hypothetical protein
MELVNAGFNPWDSPSCQAYGVRPRAQDPSLAGPKPGGFQVDVERPRSTEEITQAAHVAGKAAAWDPTSSPLPAFVGLLVLVYWMNKRSSRKA